MGKWCSCSRKARSVGSDGHAAWDRARRSAAERSPIAIVLKGFVKEVHEGRKADETGLDPVTQAPFFAVLKEERERDAGPVSGADAKWLGDLTVKLVDLIRSEVSLVGFWRNATRQQELRGRVFMFLDENEIVDFDEADRVADRLMELAKANSYKLVAA